MKSISRRQFFKFLATGAVTLASAQLLEACQVSGQDNQGSSTASSDTPPAISPATSTQAVVESTQTPIVYPDLVVARKAEPERLVREAISALGGMQRFVSQNGWVIIKPNICVAYHSYEYASTTNPLVVGTLVKLCYEAGAGKVQVMDYPFGGSARDAYQVSGIAEQVEVNGGEMVQMSQLKFQEVEIENALTLKNVKIFEDIFKADSIINVPIAKNHGMAKLTLGMKNLMGLITNRERLHSDFGNCLTDLAGKIKPKLTVIDAIRILLRNGPTGGNLEDVQQLDTIIASPDIVAADSYGATLFGFQPTELNYVKVGGETGLGQNDLAKLNIRELILG